MGQLGKYLRSQEGDILAFWCPACNVPHPVLIHDQDGWKFNGDPDKPTFTPSVAVRGGHYAQGWQGGACWCTYNAAKLAKGEEASGFKCDVCHSNVTAGRIFFHPDSTHALAGKTVDLPPWQE